MKIKKGLVGLVSIGLLAGYSGGLLEKAIMRLADIQLSLPVFLVALVIMACRTRRPAASTTRWWISFRFSGGASRKR